MKVDRTKSKKKKKKIKFGDFVKTGRHGYRLKNGGFGYNYVGKGKNRAVEIPVRVPSKEILYGKLAPVLYVIVGRIGTWVILRFKLSDIRKAKDRMIKKIKGNNKKTLKIQRDNKDKKNLKNRKD